MSITIYISGPMRGYPQHNFPMFDKCEKFIRSKSGFDPFHVEIINPAEISRKRDNFDGNGDPPHDFEYYMVRNLELLDRSDTLVLLPNWRKSSGACREYVHFCSSRKNGFIFQWKESGVASPCTMINWEKATMSFNDLGRHLAFWPIRSDMGSDEQRNHLLYIILCAAETLRLSNTHVE